MSIRLLSTQTAAYHQQRVLLQKVTQGHWLMVILASSNTIKWNLRLPWSPWQRKRRQIVTKVFLCLSQLVIIGHFHLEVVIWSYLTTWAWDMLGMHRMFCKYYYLCCRFHFLKGVATIASFSQKEEIKNVVGGILLFFKNKIEKMSTYFYSQVMNQA